MNDENTQVSENHPENQEEGLDNHIQIPEGQVNTDEAPQDQPDAEISDGSFIEEASTEPSEPENDAPDRFIEHDIVDPTALTGTDKEKYEHLNSTIKKLKNQLREFAPIPDDLESSFVWLHLEHVQEQLSGFLIQRVASIETEEALQEPAEEPTKS